MIDIVLNISIFPLLALDIILLSWLFLFLKSLLNKTPKRKLNIKKYPKVTVLIPAYNEENNIENTLKNIKSQNYPNLEIIVIDDGSKDNTSKIAKKYAKVYRFEKNKGKHFALNYGIKKSKGKFILIIDADTVFENKNAIKKMVENFYLDKKIAVVTSSLKIKNKNNLITYFQNVEYNYQNLIRFGLNSLKLGTLYIWGCATMFRKDVLKKVMFKESYSEDIDTIIRIQMKGYKVLIDKNIIAYTIAPNNLKSFANQRIRWNSLIFQCIKDYKNVIFNPKYSSLGLYSLPLTIFWFPFSLIIFPLIIYQIFYWLQFQKNLIEIFMYFFFWFSFFGNINYLYKVTLGIWQFHIASFLGVLSGILTFTLILISLVYFKEKDIKDFLISFFVFPYFLFQNIIMLFTLFFILFKKLRWLTK
ncbi:MAG: glycosyltransferase [Candidatus Aenigmatarchaeota archaeon]